MIAFFRRLFAAKPKRLEVRFLPYGEADKLIRESNGVWTLAPEEDHNHCFGWVYVERLESK